MSCVSVYCMSKSKRGSNWNCPLILAKPRCRLNQGFITTIFEYLTDKTMLISDSHEFIFLRMRKVASTSMKAILLPLCIPAPEGGFAHIKSRMRLEWDYRKYVGRAHDDIRAVQRRMPKAKFDRYFKFAFVRNPWDRLVSEYEFILKSPQHGRHARVKKLGNFNQFIQMQIPRRDAYQINMLCDREGALLMDFVGKLENVKDDWCMVCDRIGIPVQGLPRKKLIKREHFRSYYNDESRQLVAMHWAREIELFDYEFGA